VRAWRASKLAHMTSPLSRAASHWPLGSSGTARSKKQEYLSIFMSDSRVTVHSERMWCLLTRRTAVWA